jgi:hypothetical protein
VNRHERRAAARKALSAKLDPLVAYHEAGHAIGRFLAAEDCGIAAEHSIDRIEIYGGGATVRGSNGQLVKSAATTHGRRFPDAIAIDVARELNAGRPITDRFIAEAFANSSADLDRWLRGRALSMVSGGVSEGLATGRDVRQILNSPECKSDLTDFCKDCRTIGRTDTDEINAILDDAVTRALEHLSRPDVWAAMNAVARRLPAAGRVKGPEIIGIITAAMKVGR